MKSGSDNWKLLPKWMHTHSFQKIDLETPGSTPQNVSPPHANVVSSFAYEEGGVRYHRPLLDLDMRAHLTPSTKNNHLYIDKLLTEEQYGKLLAVLNEVGIIQNGIIDLQWNKERQTALRLPGIKKTVSSPSSDQTIDTNTIKVSGAVLSDSGGWSIGPIKSAHVIPSPSDPLKEFSELCKLASNTGHSVKEIIEAYKLFLGTKPETPKAPLPF